MNEVVINKRVPSQKDEKKSMRIASEESKDNGLSQAIFGKIVLNRSCEREELGDIQRMNTPMFEDLVIKKGMSKLF